ncbi:MAG: methionine--tRNA ligase [Ruminococcus sp.]|jgi:methionyl-tRNA synthetase|nr:methionine--tRNA ligase [Ruminococcus sp.]
MEKYYITTAIIYASGKPHIGNCYEIIFTDAVARYKRKAGFDVFFLTGSDEHGQKMELKAAEAGISPKEFTDKCVDEIKRVWSSFNASYDKFIRTTDDYHEKAVQVIFERLLKKGDIYKGAYEGMYCTPCESFWTPSQLVDGKCPDCGREVSPAKEEAYFLKLREYQPWLEKYLEENPGFLYPDARAKEMINNFLKPGLNDLCVSRTSFKWGIPVSSDPDHVVYVWLDALSNYITAIGFDGEKGDETFDKYWPADLHVIGKDIFRFHSIYWPIILHCLDLPIPKRIYGHQWLLSGGDKMSKSKGNTLYSDDLIKFFGVDAVRWYLLSQMPFTSDGNITYELFIENFNTDLANTVGNLVNRTVTMQQKYFDGVIKSPKNTEDIDRDVIETAFIARDEYFTAFEDLKLADCCKAIIKLAVRLNKYIDETAPWALAKAEENKPRLGAVLYNLLEGIRFIAVLAEPFMPETAAKIISQLGNPVSDYDSIQNYGGMKPGDKVGTPEVLFARIDPKKLLPEIEKYYAE